MDCDTNDFRSPNLPILYQGWLYRKGWTYGTWKKSYAVLKLQEDQSGILALYRHETETAPLTIHETKGIIEIKQRVRKSSPVFEFTIFFNKAEFVFASDNQEELFQWVALLQQIITKDKSVHDTNDEHQLHAELSKLTEQDVRLQHEFIAKRQELEDRITNLEKEMAGYKEENEILTRDAQNRAVETDQSMKPILGEEGRLSSEIRSTDHNPKPCEQCIIISATISKAEIEYAELHRAYENSHSRIAALEATINELTIAHESAKSALQPTRAADDELDEKNHEATERAIAKLNTDLADCQSSFRAKCDAVQILETEKVQLREQFALSEERSLEEHTRLITELKFQADRMGSLEAENEELHQQAMRQSPDCIAAEQHTSSTDAKLDEILCELSKIHSNALTKDDLSDALQQRHVLRLQEEKRVLEDQSASIRFQVQSSKRPQTARPDLQQIHSLVKGKVHSFVQDIEATEAKYRQIRA